MTYKNLNQIKAFVLMCVHLCQQIQVSDRVTELELDGLIPHTEYTVTVYAIYGEESSDPITNQGMTREYSFIFKRAAI